MTWCCAWVVLATSLFSCGNPVVGPTPSRRDLPVTRSADPANASAPLPPAPPAPSPPPAAAPSTSAQIPAAPAMGSPSDAVDVVIRSYNFRTDYGWTKGGGMTVTRSSIEVVANTSPPQRHFLGEFGSIGCTEYGADQNVEVQFHCPYGTERLWIDFVRVSEDTIEVRSVGDSDSSHYRKERLHIPTGKKINVRWVDQNEEAMKDPDPVPITFRVRDARARKSSPPPTIVSVVAGTSPSQTVFAGSLGASSCEVDVEMDIPLVCELVCSVDGDPDGLKNYVYVVFVGAELAEVWTSQGPWQSASFTPAPANKRTVGRLRLPRGRRFVCQIDDGGTPASLGSAAP